MLFKLHSNEKGKNKEPEINMEKTTPYKRKGRKLEFSGHKAETSTEELVKQHTKKQQDYNESSNDNKNKKKYKPYEQIDGEFKKIKPPIFKGETWGIHSVNLSHSTCNHGVLKNTLNFCRYWSKILLLKAPPNI